MTMKKVEEDEGGGLAATTTTTSTTTTHDDGDDDDDDEEIVLRTIFESRPFQQITQKLHRRFHALAGEWHSAFLSELRKLSNRSIVEEEQQQRGRRDGGGGRKRKRGRNGGPDRGVPRIAPAENREDKDDADAVGRGSGSGEGGGRDDRQLAVTFAGISLRINGPHEAKLRKMYRSALLDRRRVGGGERDDDDDGDRVDELLRREYPRMLFSLLLRYDALEGAGLQSAVPRAVFRYLRARFGRGVFECFASPFNCNWSGGGSSDDDDGPGGGGGAAAAAAERGGRYGSAFPDTDAPFGSAGSFFDLDFSNGGCCQANPPFAPEFIEKMCRRMHQFLTTTDNSPEEGGIPLMFVVFVPAWSDSAGYRMLETSPRVTRHVLLSQRDDVHYYAEGTQHRRRCGNGDGGGHRIASFDTSVFFLQNNAARELWPLRDDDGSMLKDAFAMNPVEGEEIRGSGRDDGIRGEKSTRDRKVGMPSALSGPRNQSGNTASSSTEREKETKGARPVGKSKRGSSKKKKLMAGGQDELSILASMGILDAASAREQEQKQQRRR
jgi:phosphorylated CTD-interacting factor 1